MTQKEGNMNNSKTVYINFFRPILPVDAMRLISLCHEVIENDHPDILQINIASQGGHIVSGITIHNYLRALPCKVVMHSIGFVDSTGIIVFLAGKERYANPLSGFLLHSVTQFIGAGTNLTVFQLEEILTSLEANQVLLINMFKELTRIPENQIKESFLHATIKDTNFALEMGIIHRVKMLEMNKDAKTYLA
jgi:ATP-dependent protease ClpP protease subunit